MKTTYIISPDYGTVTSVSDMYFMTSTVREHPKNAQEMRHAVEEGEAVPVPTGPYPLLELARSMGCKISVDEEGYFLIKTDLRPSRNNNCLSGLRCPACGNEDSFSIEVRMPFDVTDDGAEQDRHADTSWDDDSLCGCSQCEWFGVVEDLYCPVREEWESECNIVNRRES